jgi:PEP-CTERM motif
MKLNCSKWMPAALAAVCVMVTSGSARADWTEGFESYANGTLLQGVGGWKGWDNSPAAAGTVTNVRAHTGTNSVVVGAPGDAVRTFTPGEYTSTVDLRVWMWLGANDHTTDTYFIVNNRYNDGGPYTWTSQLNFRDVGANAGTVTAEANGGGGSLPIAYDQWAEIRIIWTDSTNTQQTFYNGTLLATGTWTVGAPSATDPRDIGAVDLFTAGSTSYFDDFQLLAVPEPTTGGLLLFGLAGLVLQRRRSK